MGRDRFFKSLGTESQTEAERLVLTVVARWKAEIEAARTGTSVPLDVLAQEWAEDLAKTLDPELRSIYEDVLDDKTDDLQKMGPEVAATFRKVVTGNTVELSKYVEEWLAGAKNVSKTIDMKRADVKRFMKTFRYSHQVTQKDVQKWVDNLQTTDNLKAATARRYVSACRGYWSYLKRSGYIDRQDEPFVDAVDRSSNKLKSAHGAKRKDFSPEDVVALLNASALKPDLPLRDLIWLGMWTGCRIKELCSLKVDDVKGTYFVVVDAKSEAGNRKVPIHSKLAPALTKHCLESRNGFVMDGLTTNKYSDRSNAIGKRFGRLKKQLGFGSDLVFHSLRKTVATQLENAGVAENVTADILGHEKQTITYGLYSGGSSVEVMQRAVEKLAYKVYGCHTFLRCTLMGQSQLVFSGNLSSL